MSAVPPCLIYASCIYSLKLITVNAAVSYWYFGTVLQGRFKILLMGMFHQAIPSLQKYKNLLTLFFEFSIIIN